MVMPRVAGTTLRARMRSRVTDKDEHAIHGLEMCEIRRILEQTASALDVAHRANVVHRDLKPENLLLEGSNQDVQVVDFGVAKLIEPGKRAIAGTIIGTWGYMGPEQFTGNPKIDHRSDIYSLACVVYEMLAGRTPFVSENHAIAAFLDYKKAHLEQSPPPISKWRHDCSLELERTVFEGARKAGERSLSIRR